MKMQVFFRAAIFAVCFGFVFPLIAASQCTCPDGNVFHQGDMVSFPSAHGTRAVGRIFFLNGCNGGTLRYDLYSLTSGFKALKTPVSRRFTEDICSLWKPFSFKKMPIAHHAVTAHSPDGNTNDGQTVSSLDGVTAVPGPVAGSFQVGEYVVATRDIKVGNRAIKRGTPGQVQGVAPANDEHVSVVFLTRPRTRRVERIAAVSCILAGSVAPLVLNISGAGILVGPFAAPYVWRHITPIKKVTGDVGPDDIQLLNP